MFMNIAYFAHILLIFYLYMHICVYFLHIWYCILSAYFCIF